jgi:hypothetical protein
MDTTALATALASRLRRHRCALAHETRLHSAISDALAAIGVQHQAEYRLDERSRLDFFTADGVAIEVKKWAAGLRDLEQIGRYLDHPSVKGCVLIAMRASPLPAEFRGKPLQVLQLWRLLL